jgi:hypothetical protein
MVKSKFIIWQTSFDISVAKNLSSWKLENEYYIFPQIFMKQFCVIKFSRFGDFLNTSRWMPGQYNQMGHERQFPYPHHYSSLSSSCLIWCYTSPVLASETVSLNRPRLINFYHFAFWFVWLWDMVLLSGKNLLMSAQTKLIYEEFNLLGYNIV